jgi:hypothetical protein
VLRPQSGPGRRARPKVYRAVYHSHSSPLTLRCRPSTAYLQVRPLLIRCLADAPRRDLRLPARESSPHRPSDRARVPRVAERGGGALQPCCLDSELTHGSWSLSCSACGSAQLDAQCSDARLRFLDAELEVYVNLLPEFFPPVEEEVHDKPER